jgi:CO/xanthine dehydrogenase Mo-binding subunit
MNMIERNFRVVGKGVPVKDALEKVSGSLKYAVDLKVHGTAHGKILRSPRSRRSMSAGPKRCRTSTAC